MTVAELTAVLQLMPQDAQFVLWHQEAGLYLPADVEFSYVSTHHMVPDQTDVGETVGVLRAVYNDLVG